MKITSLLCAAFIAGGLCSCAVQVPREALELREESLALRQLQTRRFDSKDEKGLLRAAASVLQDTGYNLDESEMGLGVIVASKSRDAGSTGQVIGKILIIALGGGNMPIDASQKIRASLVTRPISKNETSLRVTFQRVVWNDRNEISRSESLEDPQLYQDFFEKLSKAVFLEAHEI